MPAFRQALLAPVDELGDRDLLVERRDDDRELRIGDVVLGNWSWTAPSTVRAFPTRRPARVSAGQSVRMKAVTYPSRADHTHTAPDLPRRRRHRPALLLHASRRVRALRRDRQVRLHRDQSRPSRTTTSSSTRRSSASDSPTRSSHPIIRSALELHPVGPSLEIVSVADIPAGTGLGSSGTFTVGLLRALYAFKREHVTPGDLAEEAAHVEIDLLGEPAGKQDHYIAAFGGITCFEFSPDGTVHVSPLSISTATLHDLEEHLLMFFTGYSREAGELLADQQATDGGRRTRRCSSRLKQVKELGLEIRDALQHGDTAGFAGSCTSTGSRSVSARAACPTRTIESLVRRGDGERRARRQAGRRGRRRLPPLLRRRPEGAAGGDGAIRGSPRCGSPSTSTARAC